MNNENEDNQVLKKVTKKSGSFAESLNGCYDIVTELFSSPGVMLKSTTEHFSTFRYKTYCSGKTIKDYDENGKLSQLARINRDNGQVIEFSYRNDVIDNIDGNAAVNGYVEGIHSMQAHFQSGKLHNLHGASYKNVHIAKYKSEVGKERYFGEMNEYFPKDLFPNLNYSYSSKIDLLDTDKPIDRSVKEFWSILGLAHREDGPALIRKDGSEEWYRKGKLHREDGPAMKVIVKKPARKDDKFDLYWYQGGMLHNDNGPAIIKDNGEKGWYKSGKLHREDGPAFISSEGKQEYYVNGKLHREDGPAIIHPDGKKEYYKNGFPDIQHALLSNILKVRSLFEDKKILTSDNTKNKL